MLVTFLQRLGEVPVDIIAAWIIGTAIGALCLYRGSKRKRVPNPKGGPWEPPYIDVGPSEWWFWGGAVVLVFVLMSVSMWLLPEFVTIGE